MTIQETDKELTLPENSEALWKNFEKTGSVKAYLLFVQKSKKGQEVLSDRLPS